MSQLEPTTPFTLTAMVGAPKVIDSDIAATINISQNKRKPIKGSQITARDIGASGFGCPIFRVARDSTTSDGMQVVLKPTRPPTTQKGQELEDPQTPGP